MKQNHSSLTFLHKLRILFHFSLAGKKRAYPLCMFLRKQGYQVTNFAKETKYQVTNIGIAKSKLSCLLVQFLNEFKMNEIQHKTPQ